MVKNFARLAAVSLTALGTVSAAAVGAHAATDPTPAYFTANGVYIRTCPYTASSCPAVGEGYTSNSVTAYCYTTGSTVNGDNVWIYLKDNTTGKVGYATEVYVRVPLDGWSSYC